jgi:hypothetical protein
MTILTWDPEAAFLSCVHAAYFLKHMQQFIPTFEKDGQALPAIIIKPWT